MIIGSKKIRVLIMIVVLLLVWVPAYAKENDVIYVHNLCSNENYIDNMLSNIIELRVINERDVERLEVVNLNSSLDTVTEISNEYEKAFQMEEMNGNLIKITTIIPYKIMSDDSLKNSFEYANQLSQNIQPTNVSEVDTTFIDVTVTILTYFFHNFSYVNYMNFYRHAGIEAYWSSNNPTVNVTNMLVNYDTRGDLYVYPDCMEEPFPECVQENYYIRSSIDKSYPSAGTVYIDGNHTMPYNRVVYCSDYLSHGGLVYLRLRYYVDGNYRDDDRSYYVYTK